MFPNDKNPGTQTPGAVSNNAPGKAMNNMAHTHSPSNPSPNNNAHGGKMNQGGPGNAGGGMNRPMPPHNEWRNGPPPPYHRNMGMNMNMNMGMGMNNMNNMNNMNMQDPHHHGHHPGHHGSPNAHHPGGPPDGMPYDDHGHTHDSSHYPSNMPPHDPNDPQEGYPPHHPHGMPPNMDAHDHDGGMNPMMYGRQPPNRGPPGYGPPRGAPPSYMWDGGHNMHMGGGGPGPGPGNQGPPNGSGGPPNGPGGGPPNGPGNQGGGAGGGNPNNRPPSGYDDLVAAEACLNLASDANDDYPYSNRGGPPPPMQWSPNSASRNNSGGPGQGGPGGPINMQYYPDMYGHGGPRGGYHPNSGMPYPGFNRHMGGGPFGPPGMDSGYPNAPGGYGMPPDEYSRMPMMHQYPHDYPMHPNARQKMDGMMPQAYGGPDSMNNMNPNSMMMDQKNNAKGASKRPLTDVLAGTKNSDSNKKGSGKGKRPADMPRRPLSAYNFFFSEERERVLASLSDNKEEEKGEEGETGATDTAATSTEADTDASKSTKDEPEGEGAESKEINEKKDNPENQNDAGGEDVKTEGDGGEEKNDKENEEKGEQPDAPETTTTATDVKVTEVKSDPNHAAASERLLKLRDNPDVARRPHRKTHGKIGFKDLARLIGQRWRALPEAEKERYKDMAEKDLARYKEQMHLYHNQGKWAVLQIKLQNSTTEDASNEKTNVGSGVNNSATI